MTTLFVVHDSPYPARSGAPLRCWHNINVMAKRGPVYVFSVGLREAGVTTMPLVERWIHVDSKHAPKPKRGVVRRLSRLLQQRQYPLDDETLQARIDRQLRAFAQEIKPDLIVLDHWQEAFPNALRGFPHVVADAHNIQSLLVRDLMAADGSSASLRHRLREWRWRLRERDLFRRASAVWVTSDEDARNLLALDKTLPQPIVWPNVVDVDYYAAVRDGTIGPPDGLERNGFTLAYVGFYAWQPNARAAMTLIEDVFPLVAERLPQTRLLLIGKEPTAEMREAADREPRIVVTGLVDDVRPYLATSDVCVIPLTEGGGTRLKILEAFASHVPVVSTRKGAEGINAEDGKHIVIAEDPSSTATAVVAAFTNAEQRETLVRNAFALVCESYSRETLSRRLDDVLAQGRAHDVLAAEKIRPRSDPPPNAVAS